jgi:hypothetical protein
VWWFIYLESVQIYPEISCDNFIFDIYHYYFLIYLSSLDKKKYYKGKHLDTPVLPGCLGGNKFIDELKIRYLLNNERRAEH